MFHKSFRVKTQTAIKGSDRKRLRGDLAKVWPQLSPDELAAMVPQKEEMTVAKIFTHGGQTATVYCLGKNPIFFDLYGRIYPTVYSLWKQPDSLPVFSTWAPVLRKMAGGADLMLPGVAVKGGVTLTTYKKIRKGDMCSVNLVGNRAPVAVGNTCMDGEDMYMSGMKGKGVEIVHVVGDKLWEFGDKSDIPDLGDDGLRDMLQRMTQEETEHAGTEGVAGTEGAASDMSEGMERLAVGGDCDNGVDAEPEAEDDEAESRDPVAEMDERLTYCCMCALKSQVKKSDLPLLTSNFFKNFMQPFCPSEHTLDVKKSSFKKFSKFLQQMQKKGLIKMKELSKGADSITEVDKSHPELRLFDVPECVREAAAAAASAPSSSVSQDTEFQPPRISEMFLVTGAVLPLFKAQGYKKNDALSGADVRRELTEYVKANSLQPEDQKSHVILDPDLAHIALKPQEGDLGHLKWDQLFSRIMEKMSQAFQLEFPGQNPILKKGKIEPIKLSVERRTAKKKVTMVDNVEVFGIDPSALAHTVQKSVSCSCSVSQHPQKNKGMQVVVQGNQVAFIADLLLEKYKLPRKFVQGLENAPKSKR